MAENKRLIEVKSAWKKAQRIYSDPVLLHVIKNVLDETPTVDAVEVVRCKDCEHYSHYESCSEWHTDPNPEDFCSRGERKGVMKP